MHPTSWKGRSKKFAYVVRLPRCGGARPFSWPHPPDSPSVLRGAGPSIMHPAAYPREGSFGAAPVARRGPRRFPRGPEVRAEPSAGDEGRGRVRLPCRVPRAWGPPKVHRLGAAGPDAAGRGRGGSCRGASRGEPRGEGAGPVGEHRARAARADGRGGSGRGAQQDDRADGDSLRGGAPGGPDAVGLPPPRGLLACGGARPYPSNLVEEAFPELRAEGVLRSSGRSGSWAPLTPQCHDHRIPAGKKGRESAATRATPPRGGGRKAVGLPVRGRRLGYRTAGATGPARLPHTTRTERPESDEGQMPLPQTYGDGSAAPGRRLGVMVLFVALLVVLGVAGVGEAAWAQGEPLGDATGVAAGASPASEPASAP